MDILKFRTDSSLFLVAVEKLLEYYQIVRFIVLAEMEKLRELLKALTLHQYFDNLTPNHARIEELMVTVSK